MADLDLLRDCEQALAEINRTTGLNDEHASLLAALRIRIYGGPKGTLDDVLKAAGDLTSKPALEDLAPPPAATLDDVFKSPPKKKDWPGR